MAGSTGQSCCGSYEDMQILLIGAAPAPNDTKGHEKEFHMFESVRRDLQCMYDKCYESDLLKERSSRTPRPSGYLSVFRCLVNHKELAPTQRPPRERLEAENESYNVTEYGSVNDISAAITDFVTQQPGPNLLIYFSGHGKYQGESVSSGAKTARPAVDQDESVSSGAKAASAAVAFEEEALTIPVHSWNVKTKHLRTQWKSYSASQLTADINDAINTRAGGEKTCDCKIYIIIDACHAGGLVNMWQLDVDIRHNDFVVLFAGAETELDAKYDQHGGKFTAEFAKQFKKGKALFRLAQDILDELYLPKERSPCVRYSRPDLCTERLLKTSTT